jgi:hypothetical protein
MFGRPHTSVHNVEAQHKDAMIEPCDRFIERGR